MRLQVRIDLAVDKSEFGQGSAVEDIILEMEEYLRDYFYEMNGVNLKRLTVKETETQSHH